MAQTFDTSRVGGGTYELELDSTGNYKLKSVGFEAVNKLNLPDLKTSDTSVADTTKKATEDTIKEQTTEVFKPMNTYGDRGGESLAERQGFQDYDRVVPQTEKPNELNPYQSRPDITGMTFTGATGKETYKTPRTISDQKKYLGGTFTTPETGLQKISNTIKTGIDNSMIANAAKTLGGFFQGMVDSFVGPEQTALNNANKNALNSLGYKTNYELGNSLDPGRIAGNPVENVFAGMNAVSRYGDISRGAANRIATIENTISKMTPQQLANSKLPARLESFKEQKKDFDQAKGTDKTTSTPTVTVNNKNKSKNQTPTRPNMADVSGPTKKTTVVKQLGESSSKQDKGAKQAKTELQKATQGPAGSGGGGGGGCFLADTLITMADGSTKEVQKVNLGDNVAQGGKVFATGKFLVENLYNYKGIKVSGSHMVNEDGNWVRVENSKYGKSLGDDEHTVYVFGSENRRILINGILFTDYFETTEQEKLINNKKDFFSNWKTYENKIDQDNINILNAS
jgi:hypothetical protein